MPYSTVLLTREHDAAGEHVGFVHVSVTEVVDTALPARPVGGPGALPDQAMMGVEMVPCPEEFQSLTEKQAPSFAVRPAWL